MTATHVYLPESSAWALGICSTRPPEHQKIVSLNFNYINGQVATMDTTNFYLLLSLLDATIMSAHYGPVSLLTLPGTWQDEDSVVGRQRSPVFVPGEGWRGDGVGLTVQRKWVVEDHLLGLPPAAGRRDRIACSFHSVETRRHWRRNRKEKDLFFIWGILEHFLGIPRCCVYLEVLQHVLFHSTSQCNRSSITDLKQAVCHSGLGVDILKQHSLQ